MRRALSIVSVAALLTGCFGGDETSSEAQPEPPASASEPSEAATEAPDEPLVRLDQASVITDGAGMKVLHRLNRRLPSGQRWLPQAVTPDELVVIGTYGRSAADRVALLDPRTGDVTYLSDGSDAGVFDADTDDRWVVWVETTAADLFTFPWQMYSHDRRTGRTRLIAEAPDVGRDPVPVAPNGTRPHLHDGQVYFAAVSSVDGNRVQDVVSTVYSVPADGSTPMRPLIRGAYGPDISGDELAYTVGTGGSFTTWDLRLRNLTTGTDESVESARDGGRLSGDSFGGEVLTWQVSQGGVYNDNDCTTYLRWPDGKVETLMEGTCDRVFAGYPAATHDYHAFSVFRRSSYVAYVYDLRTEELSQLTDEHVIESPTGHDDLMVWRPDSGPDQGKVVVARLTGPG